MAEPIFPLVDLMFVCDEASYDEGSKTYTMTDVRGTTVRMPRGMAQGFVHRELVVFAQLVEGMGTFALKVEIHNEARLVVDSSQSQIGEFRMREQLFARQFVFRIPDVSFAEPGAYQMVLMADGRKIGSRLLRVLPGSQ